MVKIVYTNIEKLEEMIIKMKKAYIISTGTELLLGTTTDTNSSYISQQLRNIGIKVIGISVVGDNKEQIKNAFDLGKKAADIVIASGGLGPTKDDITKEVACEKWGAEAELNETEVKKIKDFFAKRGKEMPESNLKQALFPPEAKILPNPLGTAPGMYLNKNGKTLILLPGPPREMKKMLDGEAVPLLIRDYNLIHNLSATKTIRVFGPGESQVEKIISRVIENPHGCSIALIAQEGEILIKVTAEGKDALDSERILEITVNEIKQRLNHHIYGYDEDNLKNVTANLLTKMNYTIALAESCTGGLVSKYLTDGAGSSDYFWGAAVSYSNDAKIRLLGVSPNTLAAYGAVSKEVAEEMAQGIKKAAGTKLGLAITGVAGPGGGSKEKPVGLVYIGFAHKEGVLVKELHFGGDRNTVRTLTAKTSLDIIRRYLQGKGV